MNTKNNITSWLLVTVMVFSLFLNTSCEKDEEVGAPTIEYIRYTTAEDPVTFANLGQTVAIIGNNLNTVKEVTFNGYPASFVTTMVTNTSIVVLVSKDTPFLGEDATKEVIVTTDGGTATTTLEIAPPAPEVNSVTPEYAGAGAEITIKGAYFYNVSGVSFGSTAAQIVNITPNSIKVVVPQGYTKGKISVTSSKSGTGTSAFDFGLDAGIIITNWGDISPSNGAWWNSSSDGPNEDFASIGTSYKYVEATFGNTWWTLDGGIQLDASDQRKGVPATKVLKFEYSLIGDSPWIQFLWKTADEHKFIVRDLAPTGGKWATYSIPMNQFTFGDEGPAMTKEIFESGDPVLLQYAFVNSGNSDITIKCATTNFRIVNK